MGYIIPSTLIVFAGEGGELVKFWGEFVRRKHTGWKLSTSLTLVQSGDDINELMHRMQGQINESQSGYVHLLILTDIERVHREAVKYRKHAGHPVTIMRWWDEVPLIRKDRKTRDLYCRQTGINFLRTAEDYQRNARPGKGNLKLDNPVLLDQKSLLGDDAPLKMMRHVLDALTAPDREDLWGNVKRNYGEIRLTVATHFYLDQENLESVIHLLEQYSSYDVEVLDRIQFVIVDDGSPINYSIPDFQGSFSWIITCSIKVAWIKVYSDCF